MGKAAKSVWLLIVMALAGFGIDHLFEPLGFSQFVRGLMGVFVGGTTGWLFMGPMLWRRE